MACVRDSDSGGMVRSDLPLNRLHDGDLLFRCGVGAASQAVIEMDKNKGMYTHIGIAINDGGMWKVVHAVPGESANGVDLVKIEPIDTFFLTTRAVRGAAMRLEQCDSLTAHAAAMWTRGLQDRRMAVIFLIPSNCFIRFLFFTGFICFIVFFLMLSSRAALP